MTDLQEAFARFVKARPFKQLVKEGPVEYMNGSRKRVFAEPAHWDGNCCSFEHYEDVMEDGRLVNKPKPDSKVCVRERAWREYCRLRDGVN